MTTISTPIPCAGLQEDCSYYQIEAAGTIYRLHNEWSGGIDVREQRLGLPDIWVGRDLVSDFPKTLPTTARAEMRALWKRLFAADPIGPDHVLNPKA